MFQYHRSLSRSLAFTLLALSTGLSSYAGDIVGRVKDANTDGYLPGVSIKVPGTNRTTTTDGEGRYRIGNLASGSYTVQVEYLGYDRVSKTVSVPGIGSIATDITLGSEVVELESFDVHGYREGRWLALQQKRMAGNIMDLVSADSVGHLPDRNVAEVLARLPGVSLDVDEGEGHFVSIRGIEPNFNTVTYNGANLAPPAAGGREGRSVPLDMFGSSQISQVEVIKSITPDMDGNSLGGTVNLESVSGYDRADRFVSGKFELGANSVASGTAIDTDVTYGDTYNEGRVGLALSANYSIRPYISQGIQMDWREDDNGFFPNHFELQPGEGERQRLGFNYKLDVRPDDETEIYLFGFYNRFSDENRRQELRISSRVPYYVEDPERPYDDPYRKVDKVWVSPTLIDVPRMIFEQRDFYQNVDQTMINSTLGLKKRFDRFAVLGDLTYSYSEEDVPINKSVQFRSHGLCFNAIDNPPPFQYEFGGFFPQYNDQGVYSSADSPEIYFLRRFVLTDSNSQETLWTPRLDFEWHFEDLGGYSGTFRAGIKYTDRHRFIDENSYRPITSEDYEDEFDTVHTMADLSPPNSGSGFAINDGRYMYPSDLDLNVAFDYLEAHPEEFENDISGSLSNSYEDDYDVTEKILGLYFMGTVSWSERLSMIYGLRYEKTDADLTAWEFQEGEIEDEDVIRVVQHDSSFNYDNWMPNLQFRYELTENSVLRFAATATVGRPQYEKASPIASLEFTDDFDEDALDPEFPFRGEVEIGNPTLSPYESLNFDLAYEYYFKSGAMVSACLFYKAIDNPIYEFSSEEENVVWNDVPMEILVISSFLNADSASIAGLELNAILPFSTFISGSFLDGFGVDVNATFMDSNVKVIGREDEDLPFFRQPEHILNVALYYQKYGFGIRFAYNFQNESLRELDENADDDTWDMSRSYSDIQASYRLSDHSTIYAVWRNITEEPKNSSYGPDTNRLQRSSFYGSDFRAGIRFLF